MRKPRALWVAELVLMFVAFVPLAVAIGSLGFLLLHYDTPETSSDVQLGAAGLVVASGVLVVVNLAASAACIRRFRWARPVLLATHVFNMVAPGALLTGTVILAGAVAATQGTPDGSAIAAASMLAVVGLAAAGVVFAASLLSALYAGLSQGTRAWYASGRAPHAPG